ncbi:ABC transporter ATP-binding protein [Xylophilus sp.]|uniref:ABC transporter ATP-binding protein n=1 Tax=Xylophilus sp. TaxID=2653893 RepID=UPI0013BD6C8A|nr:ABC transporter ATP-binding protein [Xylophilus sp.]KAF1044636.1 MAG: Aliphatic sulfonates import ATP-binding protein SsuB [Xylophilus sp.]
MTVVGPSTAAPLLALRNVNLRYGGAAATQALADVSLDVAAGDFVSLLGPSGCGKSSVLRLVAGLLAPSEGVILRPPAQAAVGFVFQEPTLMPWARVIDNVALPLRLDGVARGERAARAAEALAAVGLDDVAHAWPRELSGGMKMRASIARALVTRPQLLLMDEPFAALDEIGRFRLNDALLALWQAERFTALFVTHSVFEAVYLSRRIVVMAARPGRVAREIVVNEPYPRGEGFRASERYGRWCVAVSRALQEAEHAA